MTNRFRVWVASSVLSVSACTAPSPRAPELPVSISPGWRLAGVAQKGEVWLARYIGPGTARVEVRTIAGADAGRLRMRGFQSRAGSAAFYGDRYFVVVNWEGANAATAGALVQRLERALDAGY